MRNLKGIDWACIVAGCVMVLFALAHLIAIAMGSLEFRHFFFLIVDSSIAFFNFWVVFGYDRVVRDE